MVIPEIIDKLVTLNGLSGLCLYIFDIYSAITIKGEKAMNLRGTQRWGELGEGLNGKKKGEMMYYNLL